MGRYLSGIQCKRIPYTDIPHYSNITDQIFTLYTCNNFTHNSLFELKNLLYADVCVLAKSFSLDRTQERRQNMLHFRCYPNRTTACVLVLFSKFLLWLSALLLFPWEFSIKFLSGCLSKVHVATTNLGLNSITSVTNFIWSHRDSWLAVEILYSGIDLEQAVSKYLKESNQEGPLERHLLLVLFLSPSHQQYWVS